MTTDRAQQYIERKVAGLCTRCGEPAAEDSSLCAPHRDDRNRVSAGIMQRKREARRAAGECIEGCGRKVEGDYACQFCRIKIDRYKRRWIASSEGEVSNDVSSKAERIAARTVANADGDGRTRYRGQTRKGQQTHAQLNVQDLGWARENFEAFAAGVAILGSEEAKAWRREERAQVTAATGNQAERACRHIDDILERLGHFKQRHGRRDGE